MSTVSTTAPAAGAHLTLGPFTLTETGLEIAGRPTFREYTRLGEFIRYSHKGSPWWLADWLAYGESRPEWAERLSQAQALTGLSDKTLMNVRAVGRGIPKERRQEHVEFALHSEVVAMGSAEQDEWLRRAADENLTRRELRDAIRASKRTKMIEGQATLSGMFRVIYADPPWKYRDSGATEDGSLAKAERRFPGMTIEELCALPVAAHALEDSVLFMWVTAPFLYDTPGPREVVHAWGFTPKSGYVWNKVRGNLGHYSYVSHEHLIIATRGACTPDTSINQADFNSVQTFRREQGAEHSAKPEEFRDLIQKLYPRGPYLELFGRRRVKGWTVFGNDPRLWVEKVA